MKKIVKFRSINTDRATRLFFDPIATTQEGRRSRDE